MCGINGFVVGCVFVWCVGGFEDVVVGVGVGVDEVGGVEFFENGVVEWVVGLLVVWVMWIVDVGVFLLGEVELLEVGEYSVDEIEVEVGGVEVVVVEDECVIGEVSVFGGDLEGVCVFKM